MNEYGITTVIAFIAVYIAYQQWNTNRQRLKLDLFDKRFSIYQSAQTFLSDVIREGSVEQEGLEKYRLGILNSIFLLDKKTSDYLWELYSTASKAELHKKKRELDQENVEIEKLLQSPLELQEKFKPFLQLNH